MRALLLLAAVLVPIHSTSADFVRIEDFEALNLGPIDDQGDWVAGNDTSVVDLDPETGIGQVLAVTTDSTRLYRPAPIVSDTIRMTFLRFRFASQQNYSFGFSDQLYPFHFGDFEVELNMSNATTELRVNDDGSYEVLTTLMANTWYNCWILVDNANDETQVWLNDRPLDGALTTDQLEAEGEMIFEFRGGASGDLRNFFIKTGGGSGPSGPLYIDDIYIENTNQLNLTNPLVRPGVGYCFGDPGSGTPCPCSNDNDGSVPESGCANGVFASGANLWGSGVASVSDDSLVLTTTGLEPNNTGLYFQADNRVNGGDGNVFGDGLRCAGGALIRLEIQTASASGASSTTIPLGLRGSVGAGDTKRYQCWYRTTVNPPCGLGVNDFNLSNGYEIFWTP